MNYYNEIKEKLIDDEIYSKVKDYSKERHKVITYYEIGRLLYEAGNCYGESIIKEYSKKLILDVNKKFNERTLRRMRQFYKKFNNVKWSPLATKLTWSHYTELLIIKDDNELMYYLNISIEKRLTKRELRERIKNKEYERLPIKTRIKISMEEQIEVRDLIPNPILIKNKNNIEVISEKVLHGLILEDIESFMKELGGYLSFVGSEYKIKIGDRYNSIDILLFNYKYNSFVVAELKVTEFKVEYISQVQKYMNYVDKNIKEINHNDTIGILICKKENRFVIEYCSDERITIREYKFI